MTWLGIRSALDAVFEPAGLEAHPSGLSPDPATLLVRGSLLVEVELQPTHVPVNLLRFAVLDPWPSGLTLLQEPDGTIRLLLRQGRRHLSASLRTNLGQRSETVHITYSWDAPARIGRLAVQVPDRGVVWQMQLNGPFPISLRDAGRIITEPTQARTAPETVFIAIADDVVPVGPMPGIHETAMVETPDGPRRIDTLSPGDAILGSDGQPARLHWVGSTDLPAAGRFAPLVLRQPYHGLSADLILSGDQRLCLSGPEIEYLFGEEEVSIAVRHLADRNSLFPVKNAARVYRWYQVLLDRQIAIRVNGTWVESFDPGPLVNHLNGFAGTVLEDLPPELRPIDVRCTIPVLQDYEALTLTGLSYG